MNAGKTFITLPVLRYGDEPGYREFRLEREFLLRRRGPDPVWYPPAPRMLDWLEGSEIEFKFVCRRKTIVELDCDNRMYEYTYFIRFFDDVTATAYKLVFE